MRKMVWVVAAALLVGSVAGADELCKKRNGQVFVRAKCRRHEKSVDLTAIGAQGPQGEKGDKGDQGDQGTAGPGLTGLETATSSASDATLGNGLFIETTATCPAGKFVVLGHCFDSLGALDIDTTTGAGQSGDGAGYRCRGKNSTGGTINVTITVDVLCLPVPS
jgi:hypothetical protein